MATPPTETGDRAGLHSTCRTISQGARSKEKLNSRSGLNVVDARDDTESGQTKGTVHQAEPEGRHSRLAKGSHRDPCGSPPARRPVTRARPVANKTPGGCAQVAFWKLPASRWQSVTKTVDSATIEKDKVVSTDPACDMSKQTKGTIDHAVHFVRHDQDSGQSGRPVQGFGD